MSKDLPNNSCRIWKHPGCFFTTDFVASLAAAGVLIVLLCCTTIARAQDAPAPEAPSNPSLPNPAVEGLLALPAKTPAELLENILMLVDLGAAEKARPMIEHLAGEQWDDEQKAQLARAVGSAKLLRLTRTEALFPEGRNLAFALLEAASRQARDPARLARLAQQLANSDVQLRRRAVIDLLEAGQDGAAFCIATLADPARQAAHAGLADALVAFGPLAVDPLLSALASDDDPFRARVIQILARLESQQAVPRLLALAAADVETASGRAARAALEKIVGQVPSHADAEKRLANLFRRHLRGERLVRSDHDGPNLDDRIELWHWDAETRTVVAEKLSASDAGILLARSLAQDLVRLDPTNRTYRSWRLLTALETDKLRHGYNQPLPTGQGTAHDLAADLDADMALLENVLTLAVDHRHLGAALGVVELLSTSEHSGSQWANMLLRYAPGRSPLIHALEQGDRRLRFAALQAIVRFHAEVSFKQEYPGASRVADALVYFARTGGTPLALVGNVNQASGQTLVARLATAGVEADLATTGNRLVRLARESADTTMVLVDTTIRRPNVREVVYRLRTAAETRHLPIALLASAETRSRAEAIADNDPLTMVQYRPHDDEAVESLVTALHKLAGRSAISPGERLAQATAALGWVAELSSAAEKIYDLGRHSEAIEVTLLVPGLTQPAAAALAALGRPSGQRALVELASSDSWDVESRQAAAAAFRDAVDRHGTLLTSKEILRPYARYNRSRSADQATQQVLASILDAIEQKNKQPAAE